MTKHQALYVYEAGQIRRLAADRETVWSYGDFILESGMTHAQEEMANDGITEPDVRCVLRGCSITRAEFHADGLRYRCEGRNIDSIRMAFIVLFCTKPKLLHIRTGWVND
jgi:hypothetical protein